MIQGPDPNDASSAMPTDPDDLPVPSAAANAMPGGATGVDRRLLEILVCPLTKASLTYDAARQELVSEAAKLAYPIRDGIPIMLPEEARPLDA